MASGCTLLRSTSRNCGSWKGLAEVAVSQRGSSGKVKCRVSSSPFKPSGHTTLPLCCNSLQMYGWWSWPQSSILGVPSIMVLMWPTSARGTWDMVSFNLTKVYGQSILLSTSSTTLWVAPSRGWKQAWHGCTYMATRPKILSWPMARLGTIKRNAISHQGFSTSPHAPAWERAFNHACMTTCMWKFVNTGHTSCDPPFCLCNWVPQTGICREDHKITHSCLQRKKKGLVTMLTVVPKCLGEMLAVVPGCLPPTVWVVCS